MLSANEIHYIVGLLHAATGDLAKVITLGEKVWDAASRTKRVIDVAILTAGPTVIIAAEVKHTQRRLDVALVEGLCLNLITVAAVLPPASLPANNQFLRPRATGVIPRSLALLSIDSQPSSVYRSSACQ